MASIVDLSLIRDTDRVWDGIAQKRVKGLIEKVDLTGATLRFVARSTEGAADPPAIALDSTTPISAGRIDIDPDQTSNKGVYVLRILAPATADASVFPDDDMRYFAHEIELEESTGEKTILARGTLKYEPDVR